MTKRVYSKDLKKKITIRITEVQYRYLLTKKEGTSYLRILLETEMKGIKND